MTCLYPSRLGVAARTGRADRNDIGDLEGALAIGVAARTGRADRNFTLLAMPVMLSLSRPARVARIETS